MKVSIILGTRPEIIKLSPVIKLLEKENINHNIIHTGQHYDFSMDKIFFNELSLNPKISNLNIRSGNHGEIIGKMMPKIEEELLKEKPEIVLVQGDTNSVLAGAIISSRLEIPLGHIEAGLRSFDRRLPEEYNRIITDHISDYLFAPTKLAENNLIEEGIGKKEIKYTTKNFTPQIHLTGNTIVDAIYNNIEKSNKSKISEFLKLEKEQYALITAHRQENVDHKNNLIEIINSIKDLSNKLTIVWPLHPRTKKKLIEFNLLNNLNKINNLRLIEPIGFLDSINLQSNAKLILTDSGGIQEESCSLGTPCLVLREKTDRQEALEVGASKLVGCNSLRIIKEAGEIIRLNKKNKWKNPYGDGKASERIINIIKEEF